MLLNFNQFIMEKKERPVDLIGVNLQLTAFGRDTNGNAVAKFITFDGSTKITIQTNGNMPKTHKIINTKLEDLTDDELREIGEEALSYIQRAGSKKQQAAVKAIKW